eukprot:Skav220764  [mRNA]  locus=scaffold3169:22769:27230:+ [translate_table: standard]
MWISGAQHCSAGDHENWKRKREEQFLLFDLRCSMFQSYVKRFLIARYELQLLGFKQEGQFEQRLTQGGAGNTWAISNIRIHCGSAYQSNPLPLQISFGTTEIECSAAGCATTRMDPAYVHTCNMAMSSSAPLFFMVATALLGTFFE